MNKYSADELFKIAYSHLQKKEFEKSTQLFEKLLNDYPNNLSILRNLSHSYAFSGAFKKAEECIKKVIKIKPDEPFACLLYTSPSPRDLSTSRMPSSA